MLIYCDSRFVNRNSMKCLTEAECTSMLKGTWWVFANECMHECPLLYEQVSPELGRCRYCGDNCVKMCNGMLVNTLADIEEMKACTHINTSLEIRVSDPQLVPYLEINLGRIEEITGNLKIGRSNAIKSLSFLRRLRKIGGKTLENKRYALFVYENQNLQRLWDFNGNFTLEISDGTIAFFNNPQLCLEYIETLANITGAVNKSDMDSFLLSNGDKSPCNSKDMVIKIVENNSTNVTLRWQPPLESNMTDIVGYTIYYVIAGDRNMTAFDSKEECDSKGWNSIFVTNMTKVQINNLFPYTRYGYYIKTYRRSRSGEQTPIHYFTTAMDTPTQPVAFETVALNDSAVLLRWQLPIEINGKISHYNITIYYIRDHLPLIEQRNYCHYPHVFDSEEKLTETTADAWLNETKTTIPTNNLKCNCKEKSEFKIYQQDDYRVCMNDTTHGKSCKNLQYDIGPYINQDFELRSDEMGNEMKEFLIKKRSSSNNFENTNDNETVRIIQVQGDDLSVNVTNLRHFSLYTFFIMACNKDIDNREQCGQVEFGWARTKKHHRADLIDQIDIEVEDTSAIVRWKEPKIYNSVIVSYQIEHQRTDLEHPKPITDCITQRQYIRLGRSYKIRNLESGTYSIRVQATSYAGPGNYTSFKHFEIASPNREIYWLYVLLCLVPLTGLTAYAVYYYYKKKHALDNIHLIANINPDYMGPVYVADDWEIDRNDVEIIKELGHGSFGMVYEGLIKSRNYRCAIKTVNESASMTARMEFLNEGSVMKTFNSGHHVVRLLGKLC